MAIKTISNSLLTSRDVTDEYLSRTFGAPTDGTRWTLSVWFKRGRNLPQASEDTIFSGSIGTFDFTRIMLNAQSKIQFEHFVGASLTDDIVSTATFRDPTAWYHLVIQYDSNEVTATDRVKIWVNNVRLVDFDTSNFPGSAATTYINSANNHEVCRDGGSTGRELDGYLAEMYFCDGQTLTPSTFAELSSDTWQPIAASPTFGSNGFFLEFGTAAQLGDDTSGNTNDFTANNIDATNQREDSPTQNHLTWNQSHYATSEVMTLRNGSRQLLSQNSAGHQMVLATAALPKTGKYYWEVDWAAGATATDKVSIGIVNQAVDLNGRLGDDNHGWGLYNPSGTTIAVQHNQVDSNFTDTGAFAVGDYFMVAYNADNGKLWFGRNGTWFDSGDPANDLNEAAQLTAADIIGGVIPAAAIITTNNRLDFRASLEDFEGTIPTGFKELRVDKWPAAPITKPTDYFDVIAYSGNGTNPRSLTGFDFQPDAAWVKSVTAATSHLVTNTIVGAGNVWYNDTGVADVPANGGGEISAFNADGIDVDANASDAAVNDAADDYMGFCWKEDPVAGFDLVSYVGAAAPQAVGHNLGKVPDLMYVRNRDSVGNNTLYARQRLDSAGEIVTDPETDYLEADTAASALDSTGPWNDTAPTTTQFTVGSFLETNQNTENHMAMLWAEIEGFSKFTSYIGTGSSDQSAPFIYCGFRPKLILIKRLPVASPWRMCVRDNAVIGSPGGSDVSGFWAPDTSDALSIPGGVPVADICASGFKIRQTDGFWNGTGNEYLVVAFAEVPFQLASAEAVIEIMGDGDIELKFDISATGDNPNQYGDGDVELKFLIGATGNNGGRKRGDGGVELAFELFGTGTAPPPGNRADGDVDLAFLLDGIGFNTAMRGQDSEYPILETNGQIVQGFELFGGATLPPISVTGTIVDSIAITGNLRIPVLTTFGDINPDMDAVLPVLTANGVILPGMVAIGSPIRIPVISASGVLDNPGFTEGNIVLPALRINAVGVVGGTIVSGSGPGGGDITLPALTASGILLVPSELAGGATLPVLGLDPLSFIAAGSIGGGSVTLPFLRVQSVVIGVDALTGTVWTMNTETFETTNYLNFDFDSLVSFADQPYGVTSSGIFLLEGADDDGVQIDANILTGISDRGDENLKEVDHMYAQGEFKSLVFQLYPDGQQKVREYDVERRSNSTGIIHARAKGARGLRSRSWQMGIRNLGGGEFTLDKLGLLLRRLTRKTRKN